MSELSDGEINKSLDRRDEVLAKASSKGGEFGSTNLIENASRPSKMVESGQRNSAAAADNKSDKPKLYERSSERERKYDSRDRFPNKSINGAKSSPTGRGRRDDDRRPSPVKREFRKSEVRNSNSNIGPYKREIENNKKSPGKIHLYVLKCHCHLLVLLGCTGV